MKNTACIYTPNTSPHPDAIYKTLARRNLQKNNISQERNQRLLTGLQSSLLASARLIIHSANMTVETSLNDCIPTNTSH